jgi:hypothetical protein
MVKMASFRYTGLNRSRKEIRLLLCSPQSFVMDTKELLRTLTVRHVSLDDNPEFVSLSYTWGSKIPPIQIHLSQEAQPTNGILTITESLAHALPELINVANGLPLWIDAICINQLDNQEKSWQVGLMRSIYKSANRVFVWLGPDQDGGESAIAHLDKVGQDIYDERCIMKAELEFWFTNFHGRPLPKYILPTSDTGVEQLLKKFIVSDEPNASIPYTKVRILLERPWWQRVWVFQEVVLPVMDIRDSPSRVEKADNVIFGCGAARSNLFHLAPALTLVRLHDIARIGKLYQQDFRNLTLWLDRRPFLMLAARMWMGRVPLHTLLATTSNYTTPNKRLAATDSRDRLFALIALSEDAENLGIVPDYTKTAQQVYTDAIAAIINAYGPSIVLLSHFPKSLEDLPSWVPDWSAESKGHFIYGMNGAIEWGFDKPISMVKPTFTPWPSGSEYSQENRCITQNHILSVKGINLGTISKLISSAAINQFLTIAARLLANAAPTGLPRSIFDPSWSESDTREEEKERKEVIKRMGNSGRGFLTLLPEAVPTLSITESERIRSQNREELRNWSELLKLTPYSEIEYVDGKIAMPLMECIRAFHTEIRDLCLPKSAYETEKSKEDAIWRTLVADQSQDSDDGWVRPNREVWDSIIAFHFLVNRTSDTFRDSVWDALLHRSHQILSQSGMFEGELKIETVDFLMKLSPSKPGTGVCLLDGEYRMVVLRHENDGQSDESFWSIQYKPLDELAVVLHRMGPLKHQKFQDQECVRKGLRTGSIHFQEITDAAHIETKNAINEFTFQRLMGLVGSAKQYLTLATTALIGRNIFITEDGHLGLGPQHMKPGDIVAAWAGTNNLVVLRQPEDESRKYRYVGEAYLHGAMEGELTEESANRKALSVVDYEVE